MKEMINQKIKNTSRFVQTDIWQIPIDEQSLFKRIWMRSLRMIILIVRQFERHKLYLNASALTFYSLMAIVPIAAIAFGIAKGFGFEKNLERELFEKFPGQPEVISRIIDFAKNILENTKGGMIAGIGIIVLFWTMIKLLGHIERSFNDIWGIRKSRSLDRKFSDYFSILAICTLLLIMSSSLKVFLVTQVTVITSKIDILGFFSPILFSILNLFPVFLIWVLFTFLYGFLPNTKVNFSSALAGGILGGSIYQLSQWIYINSQLGVAQQNAIYGSFAALPLFILWLQISWIIVLLGTEIAYAYQNVDDFEFGVELDRISMRHKKILSILILKLLVKRFYNIQPAPALDEISRELEIPTSVVRHILEILIDVKLVAPVSNSDIDYYQPALDIHQLDICRVISALEKYGLSTLPVLRKSEEMDSLSETFAKIDEMIRQSEHNLKFISSE